MKVCSRPGCPNLTDAGRCDGCEAKADRARGTAAERGYDARWARRRASYLRHNPICVLCYQPATVADHHPTSRRDLVAMGVRDPDADRRLRPLCASCHNRSTSKAQPGGWNAL